MLFGVLSPDHAGSLCLARPTKPRLLGQHSAVEAERLPSVTYDFRLLLGNRSVGIKTTAPFFEAQLDWSRRILLLQKGHLLRLRRWPEKLAVCFLCRAREQVTFASLQGLFFNSSSFSMLNGYFCSLKVLELL